MALEFKMPELGENISSAGVVAVLVKEGDTIKPDTPILEIETDKATLEVPSSVSGRISKVHVKAGDKASVGQVVLTLDETAGKAEPAAPTPAASKPPKPQPAVEAPKEEAAKPAPSKPAASGRVEVAMPFLGENITQAGVLAVMVKVGDTVGDDTPILEIETDKATIEVPCGASGTVKEILVTPGEKAQVGQKVLVLEGQASAPRQPATSAPKAEPPRAEQKAPLPIPSTPRFKLPKSNGASPPATGKSVPASPTVRRLAREIGVDVNQVRGSGPRGRISHDDVKGHARTLLRAQATGSPQQFATGQRIAAPPLPDFSKFGPINREAMSTIRQKTSQQMAVSWSTIPMVTQFDKADVTELEKLRHKLDAKAKASGAKLTVTAILLKVLASALKRFPKFNASIDAAKNEVVFKQYYHVGVAVDTERGLLVPVVRDVNAKNIFELSTALSTLAEKARNRKVTPDDLQGGCITITNLGGIGGTAFTPIVNSPEVAILGVSRSAVEPVWDGAAFQPKTMLPLSLSYDHRLIDGAEAARFLRFVCEALENPAILLFEG